MANARRLIAVAGLALAAPAWGAAPCEEGRDRTGLALAASAGGLAVAAVDADSPASASGLVLGDAVVQANGVLARTCGEYARVVREARRDRKALLLLVRRDGREVPLALGASAWARLPAPTLDAPSVRAPPRAPAPSPLPPTVDVSLDEVTRGLETLDAAERPSGRLALYQRDLRLLHRQVDTLAARGSVPPAVLEGLRAVLRYHDGAALAWASAEARREHDRQPRHVPSPEAVAPFFEDSDVAAAIDEFPFLRETVVRDPAPGPMGTESAGLWRPLRARALLWARGREERGRVTGGAATGGR